MERSEAAADESLAAIRARIKLGIAIAAMIRMMATTISSSISEKPFWFRISFFPSFYLRLDVWVTDDAVGMIIALAGPKQIVTLGSVPLRKTALFVPGEVFTVWGGQGGGTRKVLGPLGGWGGARRRGANSGLFLAVENMGRAFSIGGGPRGGVAGFLKGCPHPGGPAGGGMRVA